MSQIAEIPDRESTGLRKSNLSRSKGHIYKYAGITYVNDGTRKAIVKFNDMTDKKQITRVGFYTAKGLDIDIVKIVSLEGKKDVVLSRKDMRKGKMLKIVGNKLE